MGSLEVVSIIVGITVNTVILGSLLVRITRTLTILESRIEFHAGEIADLRQRDELQTQITDGIRDVVVQLSNLIARVDERTGGH